MGKLEITLFCVYGILLSLSLNLLWITIGTARLDYQGSKEIESVMELPLLTPILNTEPIPFNNAGSNEVTSVAATGDIYDQISPSRDPTTPISRNFLHFHGNHNQKLGNPSTLPTMSSAPRPPAFYRIP